MKVDLNCGGSAPGILRDLLNRRLWTIVMICLQAFLVLDKGYGSTQEFFPPAPSDRSRIYIADSNGGASAIPFETASTPLKANSVARSDKVSYVKLTGPRASTVTSNDTPRFFLFVSDNPTAHPPFLVRFVGRGDSRRVVAISQRGQSGFAISSDEIIKPVYRVISRSDGFLFMEVRPREPLPEGEYGFIGTELSRVSTFRVGAI